MNSLVKGRDQPASPSSRSAAARPLLSYVMKSFSVNVDHGSTRSTTGRSSWIASPMGLTTAFSFPTREEIFHCSSHLSVATCRRGLVVETFCWTGGRPETITSLEPILVATGAPDLNNSAFSMICNCDDELCLLLTGMAQANENLFCPFSIQIIGCPETEIAPKTWPFLPDGSPSIR